MASEDALFKAPCSKADDTFFATLAASHDHAHCHMIVEPLPDTNSWNWTVWRPGDAPTLQTGEADRLIAVFLATKSTTVRPRRSVLLVEPHRHSSRNGIWSGRPHDLHWRHVQQTKVAQATDLRIVYPEQDTRRGSTA